MSSSANEATTSGTAVDDDVVTITTEIWSELESSLLLNLLCWRNPFIMI
jgi:hypothetical protein